jgi:hypothetical protein
LQHFAARICEQLLAAVQLFKIKPLYGILRLRLSLNGEASLLSSSVSCCAATAEASSPRGNLAAGICGQIPAERFIHFQC